MNLTPEQLKQNAAAMVALADGKPIQFRHRSLSTTWEAYNPNIASEPNWQDFEYRVKPWQLPAPPAGKRWHQEGFTESDLPDGWRPLLADEHHEKGDEYLADEGDWRKCWSHCSGLAKNYSTKYRTTRPLPSAPVMVPWDSPEDVPGPVCWIRNGQQSNWMVLAVCRKGIHYTGGSYAVPLQWRDLQSGYEHSTDRKEWKPCTKEAKA